MTPKEALAAFEENLAKLNLSESDAFMLRVPFLEAIKPRDLTVEEHNARGAAELIRHLAQNTARDYPKVVIDQWVRKLDAYADALLDGKEIPKVINLYDVAFKQIFEAAAKGRFQDLPPAAGFDTLVGLICDWLALPKVEPISGERLYYEFAKANLSIDNCEVEPWGDMSKGECDVWDVLATKMVQS